ncbi:hypothetical protein [Cupriavidus sp. AU9028]|uniref:hypothetical protein n=1 Tax=Cupriavidus sp. AU9028 TaxID=2871157 RepID=UPI00351D6ABB
MSAAPSLPRHAAPGSSRTPGAGAPTLAEASCCQHCADLARDARRREPHARLSLRHNVPHVSESAAGVPFSMLSFECRECGTVWRLYDRANELFVSWVPQWRPGGTAAG